jgi:hypothetical protein
MAGRTTGRSSRYGPARFHRTCAFVSLLAFAVSSGPTNVAPTLATPDRSHAQEEWEPKGVEEKEAEPSVLSRSATSRSKARRTGAGSPGVAPAPHRETASPLTPLPAPPASSFAKRNQVGAPLRC